MKDSKTNRITTQKSLEIFNNEMSIDLLIGVIAFLQIMGETMELEYLMRLKPIPIVFLIGKSIFIVDCHSGITRGLAFSIIGDLLLMINTLYCFELGTLSFLIGHVCYISAFLNDFQVFPVHFKYQKLIPTLITIGIIIFLIINNIILWQILPSKILFPIYGMVLSTMAITSLYRFKQKRLNFYICGIIGAILFLLSDTIIAYTKLRKGGQSALEGTVIISLYYVGQYLILKGSSKQKVIITNS